MAWNYALYMGNLAKAGKAEYPVPVFTNTWLVQPEDKTPGDFPSGCPEPLVIDIWKAGAPSIDINAPDIHLPNFTDWAARFRRPDNPLFVPECDGNPANAFDCIGEFSAIGYSPFGINNTARLAAFAPGAAAGGAPVAGSTPRPVSAPPAEAPLGRAYGLLAQMAPIILDAQSKGTIGGAWLIPTQPVQDVKVGDYVAHVQLMQNRRNPADVPAQGYAIVISSGPGEYFVAGQGVQVTFSPTTPQPEIAGLADAETGKFVDGSWVPGRKENGDDVLVNYKQAQAAGDDQSGSGLMFRGDGPIVQRVKLYTYH